METTVVPNNFPKTNIFVTIFFICVKIGFNTFFVVAMVTKFNSVLQTLTFICFNLHSSMCSNKHKYQELLFFCTWHGKWQYVSLPLKGTLCHLVSCGGTKWQNATKWSNYTTECLRSLSVLKASARVYSSLSHSL